MTSLTSLAEGILAQAKQIDGILTQNKIPYPSFDEDTLESLPDDAQTLRWDFLDAIHNLRQLVTGARLGGLHIAFGAGPSQSHAYIGCFGHIGTSKIALLVNTGIVAIWTEQVILRIIWHYELASAIPIHGSATCHEIATVSGLSESLVVRTIRAAIPLNIFDELTPGRISHTAISRLLATDREYYQSVGLQIQDWNPASMKLIEAWETYGEEAGDPDRSAFSLSNGGQSLFTVLSQDPKRAERFDAAIKYSVRDKHMNLSNIVKAFDWSALDKKGSTLVDLGGGHGQICQTLTQHTQHLKFIVQDLPHVIEQGKRHLSPDFSGRISFEVQDFMQPQKPREGEVTYLISRCLHNWSDYYSAQIFCCLIPALKKGSQVLIWDALIDERPVKKLSERFNLQQDFIMATISNGKDRTAAEFKRVLEMSDVRFAIEGTTRPDKSNLAMIQVSWNP